MKLVILITGRTDKSLSVAQAWEKAGASGVTILEGYGLRSLTDRLPIRDDVGLLPSLAKLMSQQEVSTMLLVSLVPDELVPALQQATTGILGELTLPNNGIMLTLAVEDAIGVVTRRP